MNNIKYIDIRFNDKEQKRSYKLISTNAVQKKAQKDESFSAYLFMAMRNNQKLESNKAVKSGEKTADDFTAAL